MNPQLILLGIICLIIGAIIAWLLTRTIAASKLAEWRLKAEAAQQTLSEKQKEIIDLDTRYETLQGAFNDLGKENASLVTKVELLASSFDDSRLKIQAFENSFKEKQKELTDALQARSTAETTLIEKNKSLTEFQDRENALNNELLEIRRQLAQSENDNATLRATDKATRQRLEEQNTFLAEAQKSLKDAFGSLSADALKSNNTSFVELAKATLEEKVTEAKGELEKKEQAIGALVKPLSESLEKMDTKIQELEGKRIEAYTNIVGALTDMKGTAEGLKKETTNLVGALKTSHTRGRYGELALRRLVEHAGMFEHCDFEEQVSVGDEDSGRLRPDMIIRLPGNKMLVVDSKTPLAAYMRMFETENPDEQRSLLGQHIAAVRDHFRNLSAKAYWNQFPEAPDFVIMYMHIESSYGIALQGWPEMIEEAMKNRIIVATPTILLAILMGVGYSWNQLKTIENIETIRDAAVELHDRSVVLLEHLVSLGRSLHGTVNNYNKTIGSLEGNFLPQARRINSLSQAYVKKQEFPEIAPIEASVRPIVALPPQGERGFNSLTEAEEEKLPPEAGA